MVILSMRVGIVRADPRRGSSADFLSELAPVPRDSATAAQWVLVLHGEWVRVTVVTQWVTKLKIDRTEFIRFPSSRWHISRKSTHSARVR